MTNKTLHSFINFKVGKKVRFNPDYEEDELDKDFCVIPNELKERVGMLIFSNIDNKRLTVRFRTSNGIVVIKASYKYFKPF